MITKLNINAIEDGSITAKKLANGVIPDPVDTSSFETKEDALNKLDEAKKYFDDNSHTVKFVTSIPDVLDNKRVYFIGRLKPETNYLTMEALEDDLTVSFSTNTLQYTINNGYTWNELPADTATPTINTGDKISFKANGLVPVSSEITVFDLDLDDTSYGIGTFTVNKNFNLKGNVMSMLFGDEGKNSFDLTGYDYVFYRLFYNCATLQSVSKDFLPATTLADSCYDSMFHNCSSLATAPELPATELTFGCYNSMFSGCSSLITAPELPATALVDSCYGGMFSGCSSLITTPELPATELTMYCYNSMFSGCTSLTEAPELPATDLIHSCYSNMFRDCTSLTTAPELPATELTTDCYRYMFYGCTSLNYIKALFTTTPSPSYTSGWVNGISPTGTFVKNADATWDVNGPNGIPEGWAVKTTTGNYLTITALEDDFYMSFLNNCNAQYSLDGNSWFDIEDDILPAINTDEKIYVKGTFTSGSNESCGKFYTEQAFDLSGNCMSLLFGDDADKHFDLTGYDHCFASLFDICTGLQNVSNDFLPATTLANSCYYRMFSACISLTTAPELPATALADSCYEDMFSECYSLTTAPELPATALADRCYSWMFYSTNVILDCSNIDFTSEEVVASGGLKGLFTGTSVTDDNLYNILPINPDTGHYYLPVTTLSPYCYSDMFYDCASLITAPELPATTLADGCYDGMFVACYSLTTAPELPATTLAKNCYYEMFMYCSSLTEAPELPATTLADGCYEYMFSYCDTLVTAPELPATTLADGCYEYMFFECDSLVTAPELPATTLADWCYNGIFSGCTSLNYIKALFITEPSSSYTQHWVTGVSPTGTFVKNANATWDVTGNNGIPEGWTVELDLNRISFTIDGTQYYADDGMTWSDWINSEYNTGGYNQGGGLGGVPIYDQNGNDIVDEDGYSVFGDWTIINNHNYSIKMSGTSFTVDGTQYQAEDGMTWDDWINSEYNTGGYKSAGGLGARSIETSDGTGYIVDEQNEETPVFTDEFIIINHNYYIKSY